MIAVLSQAVDSRSITTLPTFRLSKGATPKQAYLFDKTKVTLRAKLAPPSLSGMGLNHRRLNGTKAYAFMFSK